MPALTDLDMYACLADSIDPHTVTRFTGWAWQCGHEGALIHKVAQLFNGFECYVVPQG